MKMKKALFLNNIKSFFKLSISDITFSSLLISLIILVGTFIKIDLGIMRIGITYPLYIVSGIILKPFMGLIVSIISDNVLLLTSGLGFSNWIWAYSIIPIMIYFFSFSFKKILEHEKEKTWWITISLVMFLIFATMLVLLLVNDNFNYVNKKQDIIFNMTNKVTKILIWTFLFLTFSSQFIFMFIYYKTKNLKIKEVLSIYTLVILVIVLTIWIWGPIAQIIWLNRFASNEQNHWSLYNVFLIFRIIKTPFIIPIYVIIIIPLYSASKIVKQNKNKWN